MKIFKQAADSNLFQIQEITEDQLIALNDIAKNYKQYLFHIIKAPDSQLKQYAAGNPDSVRSSMRLQISTCMAYEIAFSDIISKGEKQKPLQN